MRQDQIIALEKETKSRVMSEFAALHQKTKKPDLFAGFTKTYEKKDETGEDFGTEKKLVAESVNNVAGRAIKLLSDLFDVSARRDYGNCTAKADVVIDGKVLVKDAPVPYLLFLDKQLKTEVRPFIEALPVLDTVREWTYDTGLGVFRSSTTKQFKTKKSYRVITKAEATDKHPAQADIVTEDLVVGQWTITEFSGAMTQPKKQEMLDKVDTVLKAVKVAIKEANSIQAAPHMEIGKPIFDFIVA